MPYINHSTHLQSESLHNKKGSQYLSQKKYSRILCSKPNVPPSIPYFKYPTIQMARADMIWHKMARNGMK